MQSQTLSPALSRALYDIIHYETPQFRNENIRSVLRHFIEQEAAQGFATYLFQVLPQINNVFDFIRSAEQELKEANTAAPPATLNMQAVIDWIISLAEPVCIYRLNKKSTPENNIMDLIIVMSKHASKKFKDYSTIINSVSMRGRPINYSLYKMQQLHQYIEEGSIFHINACRPEHLIYDTGKEALPSLAAVDLREIKEQAVTHFNLSYERSISFFHGAESFIAQEKKELAAFMLHQTAELALRGTITALSKIDIRTHSIKILLQHCYRLIPELALLFPAAETQEDPMIALLENAYLNARYEDEFQVKEKALNPLLGKVSRLLIAIHQLTHDTIAAFSREWLKDDKIIA